MPTKRIMFDFFFGGASSSSSCFTLALPGVFLATAPACPPFLPLAVPSSSSSRSAGDSTTKRYLHFGQSTFFPTRLVLTETLASQLGH